MGKPAMPTTGDAVEDDTDTGPDSSLRRLRGLLPFVPSPSSLAPRLMPGAKCLMPFPWDLLPPSLLQSP